jgi:hypothetical protein
MGADNGFDDGVVDARRGWEPSSGAGRCHHLLAPALLAQRVPSWCDRLCSWDGESDNVRLLKDLADVVGKNGKWKLKRCCL